MGNFKESLTELNITKQRNFVLGGGGIIKYANCKLFFCRKSSSYSRLHPVICTNIYSKYKHVYTQTCYHLVAHLTAKSSNRNWNLDDGR